MQYHRKAVSGVRAVQFTGQPHTKLPDWMRSYNVWLNPKTDEVTGVHYKGRLMPLAHGDWIVLENDVLSVMPHDAFVETFGAGAAS